MDLIDKYSTFHPITVEYTLFSSAHGTEQVLGCKTRVNKFRRIEMMSNFLIKTV